MHPMTDSRGITSKDNGSCRSMVWAASDSQVSIIVSTEVWWVAACFVGILDKRRGRQAALAPARTRHGTASESPIGAEGSTV